MKLTPSPHIVKAERAKGTFTLTEEEVVNQVSHILASLLYLYLLSRTLQIKLLILGGYETTASQYLFFYR